MLATAHTHALVGIEARPVEVEAHLQLGLPSFSIVGLPDKACQEAKERVRSGIASAEHEWPLRRITVNLAPADLRKGGSGYDLPIALAVLAASRQLDPARLAAHAAIGELALDGRVRPVPGVLACAEAARACGLEQLICAPESAAEAALAGIRSIPVRHLAQASAYLRGELEVEEASPLAPGAVAPLPDLADVRGQERGRRALEITAAGGHNLLLAGPPGTGKTMLARRLQGLLPPLRDAEALEVTRIHSAAGLLAPGAGLIAAPPFRAPHHTASAAAIIGGGPGPRPGEVSLAHRGVLFLDELPEFPRNTLEALRQPLEDGVVLLTRVGGRAAFPAAALLVGTMNLCPCGARGDRTVECTCSPVAVSAYRARVSRALLDRIDVVVVVPRAAASELAAPPGEPTVAVAGRVTRARLALAQPVDLSTAARELLDRAVDRLPLSGRGRSRVERVSRTIAALAGSPLVEPEHLAEALSYRPPAELVGL